MKTMKLLPLKIAVTSAMIVGLGVASTANAQAQSELLESLQKSIENQGDMLTKQKGNSATTLQKQRLELKKFKGYVLHSQQTHALITEAINDSVEDLYDITDDLYEATGDLADDIAKNKADIQNNIDNIYDLAQQQDRHAYDIQNLAKAQLAGVEVMTELDKKSDENTQKLKNLQGIQEIAQRSIGANTIDINKNKESIAKNNEYDQKQTEAIDALNKASSENTDRIDTANEHIEKNEYDIKALENNVDDLYDATNDNLEKISYLDGMAVNNSKNIQDLAKAQLAGATVMEELNKNVEENKRDLSAVTGKAFKNQIDIQRNNDSIEDLYEANNDNVERLVEHDRAIEILAEAGNHHDDLIRKNKANIKDLAANNELQTDAIDALNKASSANTDRIANAELGIAENKKDALIAKAQANENKANIKTLAQAQLESVTFLGEQIQENKDDISAVTGKAFKNQIDIQRNNDSIEDLYEANAENVERLTQVDNNVFVNRLNIKELERKQENDIKDVVGMQNAIAEQADKNKNNIQDLAKAQLAGVEVMDELNKNIEKNKADADANFETLTKNQNALIEKDKEHDKLITANKTAIDANKASADAKFAATADAITKNGNAITANAKSITDLGTKVDGFDGRVTALDTKVNGFDGRISALDTKVNAFDGRITALDSKVENGMAAQAALSGLFQPYSVGKFNATAALGGYGSKSAVAIGTGYRVNPNLAFKAGAAINTSGDKKGSYNIGVNYEF